MIRTSVDLPAPLSPIRPSTSPGSSDKVHLAQRPDRAEALGYPAQLEHRLGQSPAILPSCPGRDVTCRGSVRPGTGTAHRQRRLVRCSGNARTQLTNSLMVAVRVGAGLGKQNGFLSSVWRSSTAIAPCAKPWQKLILASPCGSLGLAAHRSARSPAVRAWSVERALCLRRQRGQDGGSARRRRRGEGLHALSPGGWGVRLNPSRRRRASAASRRRAARRPGRCRSHSPSRAGGCGRPGSSYASRCGSARPAPRRRALRPAPRWPPCRATSAASPARSGAACRG